MTNRLAAIILSLGLLAAIGLTLYGLFNFNSIPAQPWSPIELKAIAAACALPVALMVAGAFTVWWRACVLAAVAGVALVTYGPGVMCMLLLHILGSLALGRLIYRVDIVSVESALLAFVLGLGTFGVIVSLTLPLRIHYDFVYAISLLVAIVLARKSLFSNGRLLAAQVFTKIAPSSRRHLISRLVISASFILIALILMLYASARESGYDALTVHFRFIDQLKLNGFFSYDMSVSPFILMPKTSVWSLAPAHILGGEFALRAMNASLLLAVAGLIACRSAPLMGAAPSALMIAGFLSAPVVYWVSSQLFEETATTLFLAASAVLFLRGADADKPAHVDLLALACLGLAVSSKPQALFFGALGVAIVLRRLLVSGLSWTTIKGVAAGCLVFAALAAGPYLRALFLTGNPFHPFTPGTTIDARWEGDPTATTAYDMVFNTTSHMEAWPGGFAIQFLVLLAAGGLAIFLGRGRSVSSLALAALLFCVALATQTVYARYQLYAFPILMMSLAALYPVIAPWGRAAVTAFLLISIPLNFSFWQSVHVPTFTLGQLLDPSVSPDVPGERRVFDVLNARYGDEVSVYIAGQHRYSGGLHGEAHGVSQEAREMTSAATLPALANAMLSAGVTHVVLSGPPLNPLTIELCRLSCEPLESIQPGIDVFRVDAARLSSLASDPDAADRLGASNLDATPMDPTPMDSAPENFVMLGGWEREVWGWWSVENASTLRLGERFHGVGAVRLSLTAFRPPDAGALEVVVDLDGNEVARWLFENVAPGTFEVRDIILSAPISPAEPNVLRLSYSAPLSPDAFLANGDQRRLAIGLRDIEPLSSGD